MQHAYRLRTDDGYDTGRVDSAVQSFVRLPVFDRPRRAVLAQVKVWTDAGESEWCDPVRLESGLLGEQDWQARWIGVPEAERPEKGSRPAYWLRTLIDVPPFAEARLYVTALGLYEAFLDGTRVGDAELTPGYTQYRARVQYQAYDVAPLLRPGRHVLAVLLADGWYRGQVGLPRAADQFGGDVALRAQVDVRTGPGWQVVAASQPGWRVAPSHITAADLIGGQREDRRRSSRPCTTCRSMTGRGRWPCPARSTSPWSARSRPRSAGCSRSARQPCGRCAAGTPSWPTSGRTSAGGYGWSGPDPQTR